ncbi:unnamed protein product [Miscanthus lutarioriparius]|uniref:Uncharacterized protein n=1 Tax=Miscanthus lutarioriparius TaxID=422564 RepID=A0A811QAT4_9POAL|nr:unnamed protein product [Miscanthus lutarioriparius]
MEAALASGLSKVVGNKLVSLVSSEFAAITGVKKDLSELQGVHAEIMSWLSLLHDRAIESDPSLLWLIKLRNLLNDIYDLLDEVYLEDEKYRIDRDHGKHAIAVWFCGKPKLLLFRRKVAHKIKAIKVEFDAIVKQKSDANTILHNLHLDQLIQCKNKITREPSLMSNNKESKIPSRDHVKSEIILELVESKKGEAGRIVSIVGLGGSGKTTLAQHIWHDDKIKGHFKDTIFWIHVSQEFCRDKLIGKLFEAIIGQKSDHHAQQHMLRVISNKLSGNKFLLVMDDAWHEDRHDWENFMVLLDNGAPGSKILLTTRNQSVAKAVESKAIFKLTFLSVDESWSFFLNTCGWVEEDLGYAFIPVGKYIVKKCGGLPLAIKTLGSVLRERRGINTWRAIRESNLWDEENIEARVFTSLKLSYIYLKDHLKQCFTFCSIFRKGCEINKDYLIEQWMAHGFIKLKKEELAHDIGNEYFDSLMRASFLHDPVETFPQRSVSCKMHDLIHDLTQYILRNEVATSLPKKTTDCSQNCRYLSLTSCSGKVERALFYKVRAVYVSGGNPSFDNLVKKSFYVRSVVLDYAVDTPFPLFVLKLEHLAYLEIHHVSCPKLPEAISVCWNLLSLHLISCKGFVTLPESIGKLKKLQTLECNIITDLKTLPQSIDFNGELSNLQTVSLHGCRVLQDLPNTFACRILHTLDLSETKITVLPQWVASIGTLEHIDLHNCKELVELPKGGHVEISNLKDLKDPSEAEKAMLKQKNIWSLELGWSSSQTEEELGSDVEQDQGKMIKHTSLCQFLSLTNMTLEGFPNLKYIRGLLVFGSLKSLNLLRMANLEELRTTTSGFEIQEEEFGAQCCFPVLSELCVTGCPKLNVKPYFPPSLGTLSFEDSKEQQLCHDPNQIEGFAGVHARLGARRRRRLEQATKEKEDSGISFLLFADLPSSHTASICSVLR